MRDARRTALAIVAIPEEMAVVEAVELHRLAVEEVGVSPAALFLNQCYERRFTEEQEAEVVRLAAAGAQGRLARDVALADAVVAARRQVRRRKLTRFYQQRLRRSLELPQVSLPHLFREDLERSDLEALAERLEAQ